MVEALKQIADQPDDSNNGGKLKLSMTQLKHMLSTMGEKMSEHQIDEILTDSDIVHEDTINIEDFAKYLMSR